MNFQRQPVDYSFVPMAFSQAKQNVSTISNFAFQQKRQQEFEENLKRVKASREQVEQAREETIVELASQYREAAGLPENDAGRSRALSVVSSAIYPLTSKEMNDPNIAAVRINDFELNQFPKILNKAKMDRYREETKSTQERVRPEGAAPLQAPEGTVGVEDEGVQRTISGPKSLSEMQTQVHEEALREPYAAPTVSRDPTAQERYEKARDLGIEMEPAIQYDIGQRGREELTQEGEPEGYTREEAYRDISRKPVVQKEMETYAKSFPETPKPLSELDLAKIAKLRADAARLRKRAEGGGAEIKFSDLTKLQNQRNNIEKTIKDVTRTIADIDNKLRDPRKMDVEGGETAESLIQERDNLKKQLKSSQSQLPGIDNDISEVRKRLEVPEVETEETEGAGPSPEAQKVAVSIRKMMNQPNYKPNKKYTVTERFGETTYYDPKKKKYDTGAYRMAQAKAIVEYANEQGMGMKPSSDIPAMAEKLKSMSAEEIIQLIIDNRPGK